MVAGPARNAIVTGAAGGIGRAIVQRFVNEGYAVALFDLTEQVEAVRAAFGAAFALQVDVTDSQSVRAAVDRVAHKFGGFAVVVNCAGTAHRESFEDTTVDAFMTDVRTNLLGTFLMCQAAVFPHMKSAGRGRIVNIASISGKLGGVGPVDPKAEGGRTGAGYVSSKAGVINLTRWIAREVGGWGIRCNAIAPGLIATPMTAGHRYDTEDIPARRSGTPEDVADAVGWLASPGADYIHGAVIDVDGGMSRA